MEELISVIVPVYKVEKYLDRCIESIVNQTYKNLEIILVDDGSPDNCPVMCDEWAKKDSRIKVIHKTNGGLSDARNVGLDIARGEYIGFVDSDDFIHCDFFRVMYEALVRYEADIASVDICEFATELKLKNIIAGSLEKIKDIRVFDKKGAIDEYFVPKNERIIYHGLCMKLYRSSCFDGLRFETGRLHEDLYITYKLLDRVNCYIFIPTRLYYYNVGNPNSICAGYTIKNLLDEYDAVVGMINYFSSDTDVSKYVKQFATKHFYYLLTKTDVDIKEHDRLEYEKICQKMLMFLRHNREDFLHDCNNSIKQRIGFCLLITNRRLYLWSKLIKNLLSPQR